MTTNPTPCENCTYFTELYSPYPGESWNRCSHVDRRINTKYPNSPSCSYGYADKQCGYYKISRSLLAVVIRFFRNV